jgi:hypothetical protein
VVSAAAPTSQVLVAGLGGRRHVDAAGQQKCRQSDSQQ